MQNCLSTANPDYHLLDQVMPLLPDELPRRTGGVYHGNQMIVKYNDMLAHLKQNSDDTFDNKIANT